MKSFISLILQETIKLIKLLHVMALNTRVLFYIPSSQYKSAIYITLVLLFMADFVHVPFCTIGVDSFLSQTSIKGQIVESIQ